MPFPLRSLLCQALLAASVLASATGGAPKGSLWIKLRDGGDSPSAVRKLVGGLGTVVRKDKSRNTFLIRVSPKLSYTDVLKHLEKQRGVEMVEGNPEQVARLGPERNSLRAVERYVRAVKATKTGVRDNSKPEAEENDGPRLDYLESWLTWFRPRAYPNDTIDTAAYARGVTQRDQLPVGKVFQGRSRSDLDSNQWEYVGPKNLDVPYRFYNGVRPVAGRVGAIAFSPSDSNVLYATGAMGGLMKSTDGGGTWMPLSDTWSSLAASSIAIDPKNSNVVYVGGGDSHGAASPYSFGLMKTTDGGTTWTSLPIQTQISGLVTVADILIDPENSNIVTAVTGDRFTLGRIIRSTNGGTTWSLVNSADVQWLSIDVSAPDAGGNRTYYASGGGFPEQLWKSTNRGASWSRVTGPVGGSAFGYSMLVACSKTAPGTLYVLAPTQRKIYKSTDSGATWTDTTNNYPNGAEIYAGYNWSQHYYNYSLETSTQTHNGAPLDVVYAGQIDIAASQDGGATWNSIGGPTYSSDAVTHNDQHALAVNPRDPKEILVGNDGGVYRYYYSSLTGTYGTQSLNISFPITMFYTAAFHPTNPNVMIGGTQDNATPFADGDLNNWRNVVGADGAGCVINQANPNIQYASWQEWGIFRTTNAWASDVYIGAPSNVNKPFIGELWPDPNLDRIYAANNKLYRWSAGTSQWSDALGGDLDFGNWITAVEVAPGDSNLIYVGTLSGLVWVSRNGGATFTEISSGSPGLPNRSIMEISINPANKNDVLVSTGGTGFGPLYRCANTGAATRVWANVSGIGGSALPRIPTPAIARDPWQASTWYVGTDLGAFMTKDAGNTWSNISAPLGLPNAQINVLRVVPGTGYLMAATYGRGMWRIKIADSDRPSIASLTVSATEVGSGTNIWGMVELTHPYSSDFKVKLASTIGVSVPATVTIPAGSTSAYFDIVTDIVQSDVTSTITASTDLPVSSVSKTVLVRATMDAYCSAFTYSTTLLQAGRTYSVSVTMVNSGSITWTAANRFRLASKGPDNNMIWGLNRAFLASTDVIRAGESKTFTFNIKAPTTLGYYNLEWGMVKDANQFFGTNTWPVSMEVVTPDNDSSFVAQTFSTTTMGAGQMYKVNIRYRNTGAMPWTRAAGHKLASSNPRYTQTWGPNRYVLGRLESVGPTQEKTFELWVTAPATTGSYNFQWQMQQEGVEWFGPTTPNQVVTVVAPTENAEFVSQSVPTSVVKGATFNVTVTMRNNGTVNWTQAANYRLMSWNPMGNSTWTTTRANLATGETVAPGASKTFTFSVKAPPAAGTYNFQWRMTRESRSIFGQTSVNVPIVVTN